MGNVTGSFVHQSNSGHVFKDRTRGQIGSINKYGMLARPTHLQLMENFQQKPALNAVLDTTGASSSAALIAYTIANKNFEVLGTNMTTALCTFPTANGGITLTTAGADGDQAIVTPHLDTNQTSWATGRFLTTSADLYFSFWLKTGANITNNITWAGLKLTNTPTAATDNDSFYLRYQDGVNGGRWQVLTSRTDVDTATDSGVTVVLSSLYFIELTISASRIPNAWINGTQVLTNGAALTTAITLIPYVGVAASGAAAAKAIDVKQLVAATLAA